MNDSSFKTSGLIIYIIVILFLFDCRSLLSQNTQIIKRYDDLKSLADSLYESGNVYESLDVYEKAANLIKDNENPDYKKIADSYGNVGVCYHDLGKFEKALEYYELALSYNLKINDSLEISTIYCNMGQSQVYLGNYQEAINSFQKSLEIDKKIGNNDGVSINLNAIGKVYEAWGKYRDAIHFYEQALEIDIQSGNQAKIAIRYSSLGSSYMCLGEYNKSLEYQFKALKIEESLKNKSRILIRYDRIGEVYQAKKEYRKAEKYFQDALDIISNSTGAGSDLITSKAIILNHLAKNYALMGRSNLAISVYENCLEVAKKIKLHVIITKSYKELSELYRNLGDYKKAYTFYNLYTIQKDSSFNLESQKKIAEFREKYETERKEREIALLIKEKEVNQANLKKSELQKIYISILVVLFGVLGIVFYSRYRIKRKSNALLEEKNLELKSLNATKDRFFTIISHDLKSPVSSFEKITGALQKSLSEIDKNTLKEYITDMNKTASGLNDFLKKLLHWGMTQTGKLLPEKTEFSLSDAVSDVINELTPDAKNEFLNLNLNCIKEVIAFADRSMIETVIRNLISNAIKFSNKNSSINIEINRIDGNGKISVINSGIGFTEEQANMLFKIDTQMNKIGNHPKKGSGLGLTLSNELIKLNGGKILLEKFRPEETVFSIIIPVAKQ